jgi:glycosyltransferase involved in cell wall biosynthesis
LRILLTHAAEYETCEAPYFAHALRKIGHQVIEVNAAATTAASADTPRRCIQGWPSDVSLQAVVSELGDADLFLYFEGSGLVPRDLHMAPMPTVCLLSDTHRNPDAHRTIASLFDHVIVYHRNHVKAYTGRAPGSVHWIPYACDTDTFRDLGLERDIDVGFVGRLYTPERRRTIPVLASRYRMNEQRYYTQNEIATVYSRARIVVDLPPGDYIPFRIFEAMSCGSLLLTLRQNSGQEELFQEGEHYIAFESDEELFEKVSFYLEHDAERRRIAANGSREIAARHTLESRMTQLVDTIRSGAQNAAPIRRLNERARRRVYSEVYERLGKVELLLKCAAELRPDRTARAQSLIAALRSFGRRAVLGW